MAAYPTRRDDPLAEKKRKAVAWSEEGDVLSPDPFAWVHPDSFRHDCKEEQARRGQESSAPGPGKILTLESLDRFEPPTRFHTADLFSVRESGSQAVLSSAKFLLGVSSSLDGEPLRRCSGFGVDWDEETKTGLVLTTARLIRIKDDPFGVWSGGQEYAPHAHITVYLLNGTSAKGDLVYYQPHYDIAFLNVEVGQPIKSPSFRKKDVKFAQEIFQLGRDNSLNLRITYARAEYLNPNMFERHHNVYFSSTDGHDDDNNEYDHGGLVIDLNGKVVGMVNDPERFGSFILSSILLNCLDSWKKYRYIARPHLGMRFEAIKLLEPAHADMLWRMYNIDDGLVVREVSKGSNAEKCGIQKGDLIECIKGECISTTIQLENLLMSICKGPSDSQNGHNAEVHISVSSVLSYNGTLLDPCHPFLCTEVFISKILALRNVLCWGISHAQKIPKDRRVDCKCIRPWRSYYWKRPPEASVHSGRLKHADNVKRGRGRPNLTWKESVKRDLKDWSITKELAMDRGAWKLAIHVPEP